MRLIQITCFVIFCVSSFSYGDLTLLSGQSIYEPLSSGKYGDVKYQQWLHDWYLRGLYVEYPTVPGILTLGRTRVIKEPKPATVPKSQNSLRNPSGKSTSGMSTKRRAELVNAVIQGVTGDPDNRLVINEKVPLPTMQEVQDKYQSFGVNWEDVISDIKPADFPSVTIWWITCSINRALTFDARDSVKRSFHEILRDYDTALPLLVQICFKYFLNSPDFHEKHKLLLYAWMEYMEVKYHKRLKWNKWVEKKEWKEDTRPKPFMTKNSLWNSKTAEPTAEGFIVLKNAGGNMDWFKDDMAKPKEFRSTMLWDFVVELYNEEDYIVNASDIEELWLGSNDAVLQNTFASFLYHVFFKKNNIPSREIDMFALWLDQALTYEIKVQFKWRKGLIQKRQNNFMTLLAEL